MSALVTINEWNGTTGSPVKTDKTGVAVRYKKANNAVIDANSPLVKPLAGNDRSVEKWLQLRIGATGPTGQITNLQWYTDGTNNYGTGIAAYIRTTNPASGAFVTPVTPGDDSTGTDQFSYSSGARKNLDVATGGAPYSSINTDIGDFAVLWMTLSATVSAPQNPTSSETLSFSWDET
jgi:hypothetical protein